MALPTHFTLNNGENMPVTGLGCWMGEPGQGDRVYAMCMTALKLGYRHFDTASGYGNEEFVGKALRDSGIPRNELYVTTKLPNNLHGNVREGFDESLRKLDCEYIDMYLIHWPQAVAGSHPGPEGKTRVLAPDEFPTIIDTWKAMEELLPTGKVRSIGVSNFSISTLSQLLPHCTVVPATNQVELHPCLPQDDLKTFCDEKGILLTAYSPLGRPEPNSKLSLFTDPDIIFLAAKNNITSGQLVLNWAVQRGTVVVPKSESPERLAANFQLKKLTDEDMTALNAFHTQPGRHRSLLTFHRDDCTVFGWTYEQLGWNMTQGGVVSASRL
ncbi:Aldo/keto reductase [Pterulicium gracile]|uniref:Aldo/keto reductase n=1 Tax=Pterulicium gracile TaxID=1884261 RepID=A0A5C3R0T8_9AGAR|nr:Aldo/keto reductase [Pterula gracilis]